MIGKVVSRDRFQPEHALLIENKESIIIPLLMETLPTAKEFKDATEVYQKSKSFKTF